MRASRFRTVLGLSLLLSAAALAQEAQMKTLTYKKTEQTELKMLVHYPPGWQASDRRPAIVFFFGGGWKGGSPRQFEPHAVHLAKRGMVAARADYRVKSRHDVGPDQCVADARSAMRWLRQNAAKLGIDPDRLVAAGGSAGGHLAACTEFTEGLDAKTDDLSVSCKPNAMVLFNPVLRLDTSPRLLQRVASEAIAKQISPTLHVHKGQPPALILYGTADKFWAQGKEFMAKSKALGARVEAFTAEGQPHAFFNRPPWRQRCIDAADAFLTSLGYLPPQEPSE